MNRVRANNVIEFLSPSLILTYFFIHKIILVFMGIIFSVYLINIGIIKRVKKSLKKNIVIKKLSSELNQNNKESESDLINTKSTEIDSDLTLVQAIEELGFIPSIEKKNRGKAA